MKRTSRLKHKSGDEAVPKRRGPTTLEQFMQCCLDSQLGSLKSPTIWLFNIAMENHHF
jgi:hypothetical protein